MSIKQQRHYIIRGAWEGSRMLGSLQGESRTLSKICEAAEAPREWLCVATGWKRDDRPKGHQGAQSQPPPRPTPRALLLPGLASVGESAAGELT